MEERESITVSIVVPIYNVEKYLEQCLNSLRNQTHKNLQIILINDGSPDNCKNICERYCKIDNRFQLINKDNEGLGYARNTGLEFADGKYVYFMDSDDYLNENAIETLLSVAIQNHADVVIGNFQAVTEQGNPISYYGYDQKYALYQNEDVKNTLLPKLFGSLPEGGDSVTMQASGNLYAMYIIKDHDLRFCSERVFSSEDLFFNLDYYCYAKTVCIIPDKVSYYRTNPDSLSHCYRPDRYILKRKIYEEGCKRLKKAGIYEATKYRFMKYYFNGLRNCIRQESPAVSKKTIRESVSSISNICHDDYLKTIISEFPKERLKSKQRLFLWLLDKDCALILMVLGQIGLLD